MMQILPDNLPDKIDYSQNSLLEMVRDEKGINIMKAAMFENVAARKNEKRKFELTGGQQGVGDNHNFAVVLVIYQDPRTTQLKKERFANYSKGVRTDGRNHAEQIAWQAAKGAMKAIIKEGGEIKRIAIASDLSLCVNEQYINVCQIYFSAGGGATIGRSSEELVFNVSRDKICYSYQGSIKDAKEMVDELAVPNTIESLNKDIEAFKKNIAKNLTRIQSGEKVASILIKANERLAQSIKDCEKQIENLKVESNKQEKDLTKSELDKKPSVNVESRNAAFDAQRSRLTNTTISVTKPETEKPTLFALELQKELSQKKGAGENNHPQSDTETPKKPLGVTSENGI